MARSIDPSTQVLNASTQVIHDSIVVARVLPPSSEFAVGQLQCNMLVFPCTQNKRLLWWRWGARLRATSRLLCAYSISPLDSNLVLVPAGCDVRLQDFHARQIGLDVVAGAIHLRLVLLLLCIRVFRNMCKEEVGMAVQEQVGVLEVAIALVVGGLGAAQR